MTSSDLELSTHQGHGRSPSSSSLLSQILQPINTKGDTPSITDISDITDWRAAAAPKAEPTAAAAAAAAAAIVLEAGSGSRSRSGSGLGLEGKAGSKTRGDADDGVDDDGGDDGDDDDGDDDDDDGVAVTVVGIVDGMGLDESESAALRLAIACGDANVKGAVELFK